MMASTIPFMMVKSETTLLPALHWLPVSIQIANVQEVNLANSAFGLGVTHCASVDSVYPYFVSL
jgi:hypothetical protein